MVARAPTDEGFASLGLTDAVVLTLTALGYEEPTPIQREAIPPLLAGRDLLGEAATGTGKTAAFALPLLQRIAADVGAGHGAVRALVLVPTRELAIQVGEAVHRYGKSIGGRVLPVYGGQSIAPQLAALRRGVDVVIATPGRAVDHIRRGSLALAGVRVVVLDEADEMLDMGFADDLETILAALPAERQTALFSATIPRRIVTLAERHLRDPVRITIARERAAPGEVPRVRQVAYVAHRRDKIAALGRVLDLENPTSAIVFCRTRTEVDELAETMTARSYRCEPLHGGRTQEQRDRVMRRFREGQLELLIATDVAARGLDVRQVSHVVNFDVPCSAEAYLHRIGRTGRAGREGVAITLAEPREHRMLKNIEQALKQRISIETVPTVADLRARRLELTRASLRETLVAGGLDEYRVVVESLADEFDVVDVATAAVKLAHEAAAPGRDASEADIATPSLAGAGAPRAERFAGRATGRRGTADASADRHARRAGKPAATSAPRARATDRATGDRVVAPPARRRVAADRTVAPPPARVATDPAVAPAAPETLPRRERRAAERERARAERKTATAGARDRAREDGGVTRLRIDLGRRAGVRPADLVGAIANETGVSGRLLGAIDIAEKFSIVEVPDDAADDIIEKLGRATIRGKRVVVARDG